MQINTCADQLLLSAEGGRVIDGGVGGARDEERENRSVFSFILLSEDQKGTQSGEWQVQVQGAPSTSH